MTLYMKIMGVIASLSVSFDAIARYYGIRDGGLIPDDYAWIHAITAAIWLFIAIRFLFVRAT